MTRTTHSSSRLTVRPSAALALAAVLATLALSPVTPASAMSRSFSADGDNCSIDLDSGLKEPGTMKGNECCSVFTPTKCVVVLKPFPGISRARLARG